MTMETNAKDLQLNNNSKSKILYLSLYDVSIPISGAPARSREIVRFLSKYYDIHLIHMEGNSRPPDKISPADQANYNEYLGDIATKTGIKFNRFGCFLFSRKLFREAKRLMRAHDFDLIFMDKATASLYGYLLSRKFKVPWVYSSHNVEHKKFFDFAGNDRRRYFLSPFMYITDRIGCTADLFVAISELDAGVFKRWVKEDKLIVIPQGFNEELFNPFYKETTISRPTVLFFGSLAHIPNKEAAYIIVENIVPQVVQKFSDVLFQFVGASPPKDLIHPNVEYAGFVSDLAKYICNSSIVIAPIKLGGGMRTKIIESLACGKVVISTPKGAEGISMKYKNLTIKEIPDFPEAICKALEMYKGNDDSDFDALKNEFSWNSILPKLHEKMQNLIQHNERVKNKIATGFTIGEVFRQSPTLFRDCFTNYVIKHFKVLPPTVMQMNVTMRCNSRCLTCNIWKNKELDELDVYQWREILSDPIFDNIEYLTISGGEPTLRTDLPEIVRLCLESMPNLKKVIITTNGLAKNKIIQQIPQIIDDCIKERAKITISVSLDGIGKKHDTIRGVPRHFEKTMQTIQYLKDLQEKKNFKLSLGTTISNFNVEDLHEIANFCKSENLPVAYYLGLARK